MCAWWHRGCRWRLISVVLFNTRVFSGWSLISDPYHYICQSVPFICISLQARLNLSLHILVWTHHPIFSVTGCMHLPWFIEKLKPTSHTGQGQEEHMDCSFFLLTVLCQARGRTGIPRFLGYFDCLRVCLLGSTFTYPLPVLSHHWISALKEIPRTARHSIFNHLEPVQRLLKCWPQCFFLNNWKWVKVWITVNMQPLISMTC